MTAYLYLELVVAIAKNVLCRTSSSGVICILADVLVFNTCTKNATQFNRK